MIRLIEYLITRRRLTLAHTNATGASRREQGSGWAMTRRDDLDASTGRTGHSAKPLNTVQPTSPTNTPETEPHQPRVTTGKSPVGQEKVEP